MDGNVFNAHGGDAEIVHRMNSRQRVRTAVSHTQPDRVPLLLWMTPEITAAMQQRLGVESELDVLEALDIDVRWLIPDYIGPELKETPTERWDCFGIGYRKIHNEYGCYEEFSHHPLAAAETLDDLKKYTWPKCEWWDYESINRHIEENCRQQPRWIGVGAASFFERTWWVMGFEKMLSAMAINPDLVEAVMDGMGEFYLDQTLRIMEAARGRVDMVYIADDLSSQQSTLISEAMYRQFLLPRWKNFIDTIKMKFGTHIIFHYHSCGAVAPLIPALIETGIDILNPLQPHARGMAPQDLKTRFGKQLCFSGGLDIQELLPRGNPQEIKRAAQELVHILGKDGGYVASAAHAVQPDTPVDNILAMLEGFKTA